MIEGRTRITRLLKTVAIIAFVGSLLTAPGSSADPNVSGVQARVDTLYHQAEVASERYNEARDRLVRGQTQLQALQADLARKRRQVEAVRRQVVSTVVAQSQGQSFSPITQAAFSDDPDAFLERLVLVSEYNDQQSQMKSEFATQARQLEMRQAAARREVAALARTKHELAAEKAKINAKAAEARTLLHRLKAEAAARAAERTAQASRGLDRRGTTGPTPASAPSAATPAAPAAPASAPSASGHAGAAVGYALAQVGDAYVWGASGPNAFDCSGLTLMAWSQAGVGLPHSAAAQMSSGTPVSQSQLQPGDLVFYYSPVHHVGIYIGNGKIVHAANPSDGVLVAPVNSMPYSGAVRPG